MQPSCPPGVVGLARGTTNSEQLEDLAPQDEGTSVVGPHYVCRGSRTKTSILRWEARSRYLEKPP